MVTFSQSYARKQKWVFFLNTGYSTMTSAEACCVNKQLASGLQAHRSANNCLASCLYSGGVVQAAMFVYLVY